MGPWRDGMKARSSVITTALSAVPDHSGHIHTTNYSTVLHTVSVGPIVDHMETTNNTAQHPADTTVECPKCGHTTAAITEDEVISYFLTSCEAAWCYTERDDSWIIFGDVSLHPGDIVDNYDELVTMAWEGYDAPKPLPLDLVLPGGDIDRFWSTDMPWNR